MKHLIPILLLAVIFSFISCSGYTPPKTYTVVNEMNINKSYDIIWEKLISWFTSHNTPIKNIDKESGLLTTEYNLSVSDAKKYVDCGDVGTTLGSNRILEKLNGNFNVTVKKITDDKTQVIINVFFNATLNTYETFSGNNNLEKSEVVTCTGKGKLEKEIFDYISK